MYCTLFDYATTFFLRSQNSVILTLSSTALTISKTFMILALFVRIQPPSVPRLDATIFLPDSRFSSFLTVGRFKSVISDILEALY